MTLDKEGSVFERFAYASVQLVRDSIVFGTGVSASVVISSVIGTTVPPEYAAGAGLAALAAWRVVRNFVLNTLERVIGGNGGVS